MIACLKRLRPVDVSSAGKTEEHKASPPTQPRRRRRVWVVRHGEREDEASRAAWREKLERGYTRWWDPFLTPKGQRQALAAGENLRAVLAARAASGDVGAASVDMVFSSPLHRTVKTAEQVALALGTPLSTVAGLSECAKAMRGRDLTTFEYISHAQLKEENPSVEYRDEVRVSEKFRDTLCRLARDHPGDGDLVVVTHREGIRFLAEARVRTPYCVQAEFEFDAATSSFLFVDTHQAAAPKAAAKKKKEKGKSTKSSSKSMPKGAAPRSRMQEATQNPSPVSK